MLTADLILSTGPCASWPRAHIDRVLDAIGRPATLAAAIDTLARRNWRDVSIFDARLTLCRLASAKHRSVLTEWVVAVTRARASAQRSQYPDAVAEVVATWDRLAAWRGDREEVLSIARDADAMRQRSYDAASGDIDYTAYNAVCDAAHDAVVCAYNAVCATYYSTLDLARRFGDVPGYDDRLDIMLDLARRLDEASSRVGGIR